jgi:hypothetical protein
VSVIVLIAVDLAHKLLLLQLNVTTSPSIIRVIKSKSMRWVGHVAQLGRRGMRIEFWWESQKERDHWEDQDLGGWPISKWILDR